METDKTQRRGPSGRFEAKQETTSSAGSVQAATSTETTESKSFWAKVWDIIRRIFTKTEEQSESLQTLVDFVKAQIGNFKTAAEGGTFKSWFEALKSLYVDLMAAIDYYKKLIAEMEANGTATKGTISSVKKPTMRTKWGADLINN